MSQFYNNAHTLYCQLLILFPFSKKRLHLPYGKECSQMCTPLYLSAITATEYFI